jgi:hypothetical protein
MKKNKNNIINMSEYKASVYGTDEYRQVVTDEIIQEIGRDLMKLLSSYGYNVIQLELIYNLITALKAVIYQAEGFESPTRELVQSVLNEPWKLEIIMDVAREMDFLPEGDIPTTSKGEENDPDD